MKKILFSLMLGISTLATPSVLYAQNDLQIPSESPRQTLIQDFGLSKVEISYSRPLVKGRKIFGDIVPYDKLWRTGANAPTTIKFSEDVKIEGHAVPAGQYTLLTIPGKAEWTIILNKNSKNKGVNEYDKAEDVLRFKVKSKEPSRLVHSLTIEVDDVRRDLMEVRMLWEKTLITFNITADIDHQVISSIDAAMKKEGNDKPYFQAAHYYYETNRDLKKALEWVDQAIKNDPAKFWILHLKAKIQLKEKDYQGAVATAQKSLDAAKNAKNADYVNLNEKLINEAKKQGS